MDISERLAAHAAGQLHGDEATALQAQLASDPALRAELAAIVKVDRLLADLPAPAPDAAFSASLRETLRAELGQHAAVVSLDERRSRRDRWMKPLAGVAAAAAVIGVLAVALPGGGGADLKSSAMDRAQDDSFATAAMPEADGVGGPVYAEGGEYDQTSLNGLGDRHDIQAALSQASGDPALFQSQNYELLSSLAGVSMRSAGVSSSGGVAEQAPGDGVQGDAADSEMAAPQAPADFEDAFSRCVPELLDGDRVPLFADLGSFEGEDALVVVLGSRASDGTFGRLEFWVMAHQDDCRTIFFSQLG